MSRTRQFLIGSLFMGCLIAYFSRRILSAVYHQDGLNYNIIAEGLCLLLSLLTSMACWDIYKRKPSDGSSLSTVIKLWLSKKVLRYKYKKLNMAKLKAHFSETQKKLLLELLDGNKETSYSKDVGLSEMSTMEAFRSHHPLTTYDTYKGYVDRCLKGESNVLCKFPINCFVCTSGTSGTNKVYPYNWETFMRSATTAVCMPQNALTESFPQLDYARPRLSTSVIHAMTKTESGAYRGPIASKYFSSMPQFLTCTPKLIGEIHSEREAYYLSALFGMQVQDICHLYHDYASSAYAFYMLLEEEWNSLCDDIERGTVNDKLNIPINLKTQFEKLLKPNQKRADELRAEFSLGMKGIAHRIWPEVVVATVIATGSFQIYKERVQYYMDGIALYADWHVASEGVFGINVNPTDADTKFYLNPLEFFYEFIPEANVKDDQPPTVLPGQLEIGQSYELVTTNRHGFYRYRIGDVIKIVGFDGQLPVYQFMYRSGQILSVATEKLSERVLHKAVHSVVSKCVPRTRLVEFTATESINLKDIEGIVNKSSEYYVIFLEVASDEFENEAGDIVMTPSQKQQFDANLRLYNASYDWQRANGGIDSPQVMQVKTGTFQGVKQKILEMKTMTGAMQYKVPKAMRNKELLKYLVDNVIRHDGDD